MPKENGRAASLECVLIHLNPVALKTAKTPWSFGCSECNRVNAVLSLII